MTGDLATDHGKAARPKIFVAFEDLAGHRSLIVRRRPVGDPKAVALFVPAFGDEMNQMRRMVRLAAEALADRGVASCVFDLHGTGDSSADFSEATVERWLADCQAMLQHARAEFDVPLLLVGCRLGAALAAQSSHSLEQPAAALIGWAPVLQGRSQLSAMMRVAKLARQSSAEGRKPAQADPRSLWAAGEVAILGGYPMSPTLASQLEQLDARSAPNALSATLVDVRLPSEDHGPVTPSEALRMRAAAWTAEGVATESLAVAGSAFWNVADLVDVPSLVEATVAAVDRSLAGVAV